MIKTGTFSTLLRNYEIESSTKNLYNSRKTKDSYILELVVPGAQKEDIGIKLTDGKLQIELYDSYTWSAKRNSMFLLPPDADTKSIEATLKDGILTVTIGIDAKRTKTIKIS